MELSKLQQKIVETNEDKVVVAPEKFTNGNPVNDPICEDWVKVKS